MILFLTIATNRITKPKIKETAQLCGFFIWRRVRDLNPRYGVHRTHDFQSCSFGRSDNSANLFGGFSQPVFKAVPTLKHQKQTDYLKAAADFCDLNKYIIKKNKNQEF